MSRTAVAILSTENLRHNIAILKSHAPKSKMIAMVKANGYGHGIRSVSQRLQDHVDILGVASIDEALALRKVGVKAPILLAEGVFEPAELLIASTENFQVVFHSDVQLQWLDKASLPKPLTIWLKINTGMGRLGFLPKDAEAHFKALSTSTKVEKPIRIMSHFACADQKDHPLNATQIERFSQFRAHVDPLNQCEYSLCNSAGILNFPQNAYNYVRPGLAVYGVSPINGITAERLGLKPVMTLQSSLISIETMPKGATIGYGARYECPEDMPIGIIAFGYGDGYPITARDGTPVLVNHAQCPLIGRVSMDMMAVDLRPLYQNQDYPSGAAIGDPVILWGEGLPLETVASYTSNLTYDILTGIQNRVRFLWTQA